jgi:hypothetical protein
VEENPMVKKWLTVGIIFLLLGMSIPVISASPNEDIKIYISAGVLREKWGRFGLGYCIRVDNKGDQNITGICYVNCTTLSGKIIDCFVAGFNIGHLMGFATKGITIIDCHPLNLIYFTVIVEDLVVTKSGFEIGPFVVIVK